MRLTKEKGEKRETESGVKERWKEDEKKHREGESGGLLIMCYFPYTRTRGEEMFREVL